jgi:hypothetical protein
MSRFVLFLFPTLMALVSAGLLVAVQRSETLKTRIDRIKEGDSLRSIVSRVGDRGGAFMKRLAGLVGSILVAFVLLVPAVLAADPLPHTGRVLVSSQGDITVPAGEHADVVVVVNGVATIHGDVNTIVVVDGSASLLGARAETIVAVRSPIELGVDTVVLGDVMTIESVVHQTGNAEVVGRVTNMATAIAGFGFAIGSALLLLWIGFGLAMIVAGLLLAGLASRQVRAAEAVISEEPVTAFVAGIVGLFAFPIIGVALIATLVGAPLGVALLFQVWPMLAFIGYLVAGIWIGEWVLHRTSTERIRERPYLASSIGLLILGLLGLVPVLGIVSAIASLFGFGAVMVLTVRTIRGRVPRPTVAGHAPAPMVS